MTALSPFAHLASELLFSALSPPRCAACDVRVPLQTIFCPPCAGSIVRAYAHEEGRHVGFVYGGAIERAITRFKFESREELVRPLADALFHAVGASLRAELAARDARIVLVPVPLHPLRFVERGYNQSALLGRKMAERLGLRMATGALARTRNTAHQVGLERVKRLSNVAGSIRVALPPAVRGAHVLLVDDVETTGATFAACREALFSEGAVGVSTLVLAASGVASEP